MSSAKGKAGGAKGAAAKGGNGKSLVKPAPDSSKDSKKVVKAVASAKGVKSTQSRAVKTTKQAVSKLTGKATVNGGAAKSVAKPKASKPAVAKASNKSKAQAVGASSQKPVRAAKAEAKPSKSLASKGATKVGAGKVGGGKLEVSKPVVAKPSKVRKASEAVVAEVQVTEEVVVAAAPKKIEDYSRFRTILLALRERLKGDVQMMSQEALGTADSAVDNHAPIHPAEVGSHSFEQEFTLNLLSSDGDRLGQIEAALEKISDGTYGACEECGGRIPKARLEIIPDTPFCVKCASKLEG